MIRLIAMITNIFSNGSHSWDLSDLMCFRRHKLLERLVQFYVQLLYYMRYVRIENDWSACVLHFLMMNRRHYHHVFQLPADLSNLINSYIQGVGVGYLNRTCLSCYGGCVGSNVSATTCEAGFDLSHHNDQKDDEFNWLQFPFLNIRRIVQYSIYILCLQSRFDSFLLRFFPIVVGLGTVWQLLLELRCRHSDPHSLLWGAYMRISFNA